MVATSDNVFREGSTHLSSGLRPPVKIGVESWFGAHMVVNGGVRAGTGGRIGVFGVATHDVQSGSFHVGDPARMKYDSVQENPPFPGTEER